MSPRLTAEQRALCESVPRLVSRLAKRHAGRTPSVDRSDFESAGDEALVACTLDYRPEDGSFEEHALARVDYAMRDLARKAMKLFTRERPRREQLRPARREDFDTPEEATAAMFADVDMPPRARLLRDLELQAAAFTAAELEQEERATVDVVETQHRALELRTLRAAVDELEARERAVYEAIYREERQVNEIAEALGVDRRTISRMTERIREHIAVRLRPLFA